MLEYYVHPVTGVADELIPWPSNPAAGDKVYMLLAKDSGTIAAPGGWTTLEVNEGAAGMTYRLVERTLVGDEAGTFSYNPGGAAQWRCGWLHVRGDHTVLGSGVVEAGFVTTASWGSTAQAGAAGKQVLLLGAADTRGYTGRAPANADQTFIASPGGAFCAMYLGEMTGADPLVPGDVTFAGQTYHHGAHIVLSTDYAASTASAHPSSQ